MALLKKQIIPLTAQKKTTETISGKTPVIQRKKIIKVVKKGFRW